MIYIYDEKNSKDFKNLYNIIKLIKDNKDDIVFKSAIPRLKTTKYRGSQAFKQLVNKMCNKSVLLTEQKKKIYLLAFKLVFNFDACSMPMNNNDCIICNYLDDNIKKNIILDKFIISNDEPVSNKDLEEKNKLKIISDFIDEYKLNENEILKLNIWLLKKIIK